MSGKQKLSDIDSHQFWQDVIKNWRDSGLSVRQFCKGRDLPNSSFYYWRKKLTS